MKTITSAAFSRALKRCLLTCALLLLVAHQVDAQAPPAAAAADKLPANDPLRSPRDTLKTLYYSVMVYDWHPEVIDDAIACLDLGDQDREPADAAQLAIQLENVLKEMTVPLNSVPESSAADTVTICNHDGCTITLSRQADWRWRFDRATVARIPAMYLHAVARHRDLEAERAVLRENYTDPSATMRRFLLDSLTGDFYSAAQALDLSTLAADQRDDQGPLLAQQLACVIQRRGWAYFQEIPNTPGGPPFTWHADRTGRVSIERVRGADGKDAWLFTRQTVTNLPRMYAAALTATADPRWVRINKIVPFVPAEVTPATVKHRPETVPVRLGSPRDLLKGFFRSMDEAEISDAKLGEALDYLDLSGIPQHDRRILGARLASKLDAVLRKIDLDLSAVPEEWNAPPQVLGQAQGLRVEIVRQRDGCWRFSRVTVGQLPALFDKLASQEKTDRERSNQLESARDTMATFLAAVNKHDYEAAAMCLDLEDIHPAAQAEVGPLLAFKLKWVIDRIGRVYVQAVPDEPNGARYVFYRGDLGRITIARQTDGPRKGCWLFTSDTVARVETMFRTVMHDPVKESLHGMADCRPNLWEAPGIWLRFHIPPSLRPHVAHVALYQWLGLVISMLAGWLVARLVLGRIYHIGSWGLKRGGSCLTSKYVCQKLRPLTWVVAWWLAFQLLTFLDLPVAIIDAVLPLKKFLMASLLGWVGLNLIDFVVAVCTNTELLKPHRNLSEMVVPVLVRVLKGGVILFTLIYMVYQFGEGESLGRFLTGLGVVGLTASLAAQDSMKSFFGTLLLIGERSFRIGDRILVGGQEGVVEEVGFRSTRLRTSEGSLLTIPNSTLASIGIDNMGARSFRPFRTSVYFSREISVDQLGQFREQLQDWVAQHPGVDREKVDIAIQRITENGVELGVNLQLVVTDADEESQVRDEIHCAVLRLAQSMNVSVSAGRGKPEPARQAA